MTFDISSRRPRPPQAFRPPVAAAWRFVRSRRSATRSQMARETLRNGRTMWPDYLNSVGGCLWARMLRVLAQAYADGTAGHQPEPKDKRAFPLEELYDGKN